MSLNERRRSWIRSALFIGGLAASAPLLLTAQFKAKKKDEEEDVSPAEDLMREHGVLKRVLLTYRDVISRIANKKDFPTDVVMSSAKLIRAFVADYHEKLERFVRMYEPHETREDTILFPEFRKIVSKHEYDSLGDEFEKKENELFRGDGFEKNVDAVAKLEKQLGIDDLAHFTPSV